MDPSAEGDPPAPAPPGPPGRLPLPTADRAAHEGGSWRRAPQMPYPAQRRRRPVSICTANVSSWGGALSALQQIDADVLMLQEHKGEAAQIAAHRRARGAAYLLHALDGHGPRQGRSCGVAIAVKPHLAYRPLQLEGQRGRVCGGILRTAALGEILLATVYAPDGGNLAPGSPADVCLAGVLDAVRAHCLPTIIGGDFNKSPSAVAQWLQQQGSALQVWATPGPTFRGGTGSTNIDFS